MICIHHKRNMKTRSQTKNEALKTKSTVEKTKSTVEKTKSTVEKTKSSLNKPSKKSLVEKPCTRSSSSTNQTPSSSTNVVTRPSLTQFDTSVHLINSMEFPKPLTIQRPPKPILYEPIDFDDASVCWRMNKQSLGNGQYKYVCAFMKIDNTRCGRNVKKGCMACRYHL